MSDVDVWETIYPTPEQLGALQQTEDELGQDERKKYYLLLTSYAVDLGEHELRVLARVAERLDKGRKQYGALDPADGRDWTEEAAQEALDMAVYLALATA